MFSNITLKDIEPYIIGAFTTAGGWLIGRGKRKNENLQLKENIEGEHIDNLIKVDNFNSSKWQKMTDENKALKFELEKAYETIESMRLDFTVRLNTVQNQLRSALDKIQDQQVEINLIKTIKS